MAEEVGALRVGIRANSAEFEKDMGRARAAVATSARHMQANFGRFQNSVKEATAGLFTFRSAIAALGVGAVLRSIVNTSAEFQRLQASLKTVTGSTEAATAAFDGIKKFAATTPFDLQQVTGAFIKLKALGLDPSAEALESYGNTASAMGKSLNDFVEAVADAITGEFERLKEFGIRSSTEGDRVKFTFQGITTEVGKNAEEIEAYLRRIGQVQFAGAMDEQAKTLGGALSNLGDSASVTANAIGEGGLSAAVADAARWLSDMASESDGTARQIGSVLGAAVRGLTAALKAAADNVRLLAAAVAGFIAMRAATVFGTLGVAVVGLAAQLRTAAGAMAALNVVMAANPIGAVATVIGLATAALVAFYDKTIEVGTVSVRVGDVVDAVWTTIWRTITGLVESIAYLIYAVGRLVALDFDGFVRNWTESGKAINDAARDIIASWGRVGASGKDLGTTAASVHDHLLREAQALREVSRETETTTKKTGDAADKIGEIRAELEFELAQLKRTATEQELYNLAKKEGITVNEAFRREIEPLVRKLQEEEKAAKAAKKAQEERAQAVERNSQAARGVIEENMTAQEKYNEELRRLEELKPYLGAEQYARAVAKAKKELDEANKELSTGRKLVDELGLSFTSAFEDAIANGKELGDVLRALEQDLIRLAMRKLVTEPLFNAAGDLFGDLLGGLNPFGGGGPAGIPTSGDWNGSAPGAHTGGSFMVGGARGGVDRNLVQFRANVGERVTIETPQQMAQRDGGGAMGGGTVTVNVYAPPGSSAETRESSGPGGRTIDVIIDEITAKNISTPGSRTSRAVQRTFAGVTPQLQGR